MTFRLNELAAELNARLEQMNKIENIRDHLVYIRSVVKSEKMKLVLDRIQALLANFIIAINTSEPFHPDFAPTRLHCFANILEQTLIAALIECDRMTAEKATRFGTRAMSYLKQSQRNQLLKFWCKNNCAKYHIKLVMEKWDDYTIQNMTNAQPC